MARIGIIGAMSSEVVTYCEFFGAKETKCGGIFRANAFGHEIFICESGIGKVNAAMAAEKLIDVFRVEYLINSGVGGVLTKELSTCDAVIGKELIYHDFTPLEILENNSPFMKSFPADEKLISIAMKACEEMKASGESFKYICGNIVSGDCFVNDGDKAKYLREHFGAFCTEMEGAAIAHVATVHKIPFAVIRTASDFADENADISFDTVQKVAARRASYIVTKMLESIGGKEEIVPAKEEDMPAILEIIRQTVEKMRTDLNGQWDEKYPLLSDFLPDLAAGTLYVYKADGKVVGTVTVNGEQPEEYGAINWKYDRAPMCIHRMAILPAFRGRGISKKLFDFAKSKSQGYMRADTYSENILMSALYLKNGFTKVGEMSFQSREKPFVCFEYCENGK